MKDVHIEDMSVDRDVLAKRANDILKSPILHMRLSDTLMQVYGLEPSDEILSGKEKKLDEKEREKKYARIHAVEDIEEVEKLITEIEKIIHEEAEAGNYGVAELAHFAGMKERAKELQRKKDILFLDGFYSRYSTAKTEDEKEKIATEYCTSFFSSTVLMSVADPRVKELRSAYARSTIRQVYADKKMAKNGEAFEKTVRELPHLTGGVGSLDEKLRNKIHAQAIERLEDIARSNNRAAVDLLGKFLDLGIIDFDADAKLIDKLTKGRY